MGKTVFVLGAGASHEVGLPIGDGLTQTVRSLLDLSWESGHLKTGDALIAETIQIAAKNHTNPPEGLRIFGGHVPTHADLIGAARSISGAMPRAASIDNFVDAHRGKREVELCAKLAIARAILSAESGSSLAVTQGEDTFNYERVKTTWYAKVARLLREDCRVADLASRFSSLGLVIFNYDRCFEHFLAHDLSGYYGISLQEAEALVDQIDIYHPYGTVGDLPRGSNAPGVAFGAEVGARALIDIAGRLKTFTEGTDPAESRIGALRNMMDASSRIVFLGFAFWRQNMRLMFGESPDPTAASQRSCFATVFKVSESNREHIRGELARATGVHGPNIRLTPMECKDFIDEHSRWLSFV